MSDFIVTQTRHFVKPGPKNTTDLLSFAVERFRERGPGKLVVASCTGRTAEAAAEAFGSLNCRIVVVGYVAGYAEANRMEMPQEVRDSLEARGIQVVTAAHAFGGVGRGLRNKLGSFQVDEIMAHTLRMLGQGVKVGVEITLMAADRGFVQTGEEIMTISGSGRGADTAMIVQAANSHHCLDLKVKEILAKPLNP